jgi:hypothetical protein
VVVALIGRVLAWLLNVIANPPVPRRFGAHLRRFVLLLIVLAALCLAPLYVSPHAARVVAAVLVGVVLVTALIAATAFRRLLDRFVHGDTLVMFSGRVRLTVPTLGRQVQAVEGMAAILRRTGLSLPALLFFCGWALIYMLIWAHSPDACSLDLSRPCSGAFQGAGHDPTFGDFLYFATNMAFANPAPDLVAHSRLAHTAATIEVLTGIGLVTLYAGSFFGIGRRADIVPDEGGEPAATG